MRRVLGRFVVWTVLERIFSSTVTNLGCYSEIADSLNVSLFDVITSSSSGELAAGDG